MEKRIGRNWREIYCGCPLYVHEAPLYHALSLAISICIIKLYTIFISGRFHDGKVTKIHGRECASDKLMFFITIR